MNKLDLTAEQWHIIDTIIAPYRNFLFVFGSRTSNQARRYSDLDLCLKLPNSDDSIKVMADLNEQFCHSDLPFTVDLLNYWQLEPSFQKLIDQQATAWNHTVHKDW